MGLTRKKKKELYLYCENDEHNVRSFLETLFGEYEIISQQKATDGICVDILLFKPNENHDYWIMTTCGMGAYRMNVPAVMEEEKINRAELMIALPKQWDVSFSDNGSYWPVKLLKLLANLPVQENSWLGYGHTIDFSTALSENCSFTGIILSDYGQDDVDYLQLENSDKLIVYAVIPLYEEEIAYKNFHDAESLFSRLGEEIISSPVNINRERKAL